jgi:hypothetical protein
MREVVPLVDVLWNDLVHCAPIHPSHVYRALLEAGARVGPAQFFRIPVAALAGRRTVWFDPRGERSRTFPLEPDEVRWFDPTIYRELDTIPDQTRAYYQASLASGRRPLLFVGIPHVLVQGSIEVADTAIVDWSHPPTG